MYFGLSLSVKYRNDYVSLFQEDAVRTNEMSVDHLAHWRQSHNINKRDTTKGKNSKAELLPILP